MILIHTFQFVMGHLGELMPGVVVGNKNRNKTSAAEMDQSRCHSAPPLHNPVLFSIVRSLETSFYLFKNIFTSNSCQKDLLN